MTTIRTHKAKTFKLWHQIFLVVGLLGLVDIATRGAVQQATNFSYMGYISTGALYLSASLFGTKIAAIIAVSTANIFSFSLGWLVLAYFMNQKANVVEDPSEQNQKKYKRAKIIALVLGGLFLAITLLPILMLIFSGI